MDGTRQSLRAIADKWLALRPDTLVEVTRYAHGRQGEHANGRGNKRRCVYIRALGMASEVGLFFFRHDDGAWYIFPPSDVSPVVRIFGEAA
ncbi:hypothetical protein [Paraburkholderia pallida]|uniref:Uncharacterized protein n=1 Tax=Paraburkholderia pallida TaxID=2547399 RepID=A0A4P7CYC2_9BURK|nr:hypothetical protein [Paraburkholderia pallida]QBR01289.1 hypothetical protein E1956_29210 [Paraburkholderia pallida]